MQPIPLRTRFEVWVHEESGADTPVQTVDHAIVVEAMSSLEAATARATDWWLECAVIPARLAIIVKDEHGVCTAFEARPETRPRMERLDAVPPGVVSLTEAEIDASPMVAEAEIAAVVDWAVDASVRGDAEPVSLQWAEGHGPTEPAPSPPHDEDECRFHKVRDKTVGRDKLALELRAHGEIIDGRVMEMGQARRLFYVFDSHERVRAFVRQLQDALAQIPEPN